MLKKNSLLYICFFISHCQIEWTQLGWWEIANTTAPYCSYKLALKCMEVFTLFSWPESNFCHWKIMTKLVHSMALPQSQLLWGLGNWVEIGSRVRQRLLATGRKWRRVFRETVHLPHKSNFSCLLVLLFLSASYITEVKQRRQTCPRQLQDNKPSVLTNFN